MKKEEFEKVIRKLNRIDVAAAEYVQYLYNESKLINIKEHSTILDSLFTWGSTPQGREYWRDISYKYRTLPNVTKLGNEL